MLKSISNKASLNTILLIVFSLAISFSAYSQNFLSENLLKKGSTAPNFNLKTSNGKQIKLSDYKGKTLILDFWYVGCKPCVKAYLDIKSLENELGKDKFVILGMNPISRKNKIKRYIKKGKYNDIAIICSDSIKNQYKIRAYPTIYIINKQGKIAFATAGYSSIFKSDIKRIILGESKKNSFRKFL